MPGFFGGFRRRKRATEPVKVGSLFALSRELVSAYEGILDADTYLGLPTDATELQVIIMKRDLIEGVVVPYTAANFRVQGMMLPQQGQFAETNPLVTARPYTTQSVGVMIVVRRRGQIALDPNGFRANESGGAPVFTPLYETERDLILSTQGLVAWSGVGHLAGFWVNMNSRFARRLEPGDTITFLAYNAQTSNTGALLLYDVGMSIQVIFFNVLV